MSRLSLLAALALGSATMAAAPAYAQASPVAGSWEIAMETPVGERRSTMTIAPADASYTVSFVDPPADGGGAVPQGTITEVKVDGNAFSFKRSLTIEQGPIELRYSGTVDGNALTGSVDTDFGAFAIKGTRSGS